MSDENGTPIDNEEPESTSGYKAPAKKSLSEIAAQDGGDESLVKYKETLLEGANGATADAQDSRRVVVEEMALVVDGRDDVSLDLTGDLTQLKDKPIIVKEGIEFRIRITFRVQHEMISGLRYHHAVLRKGISVDKQSYMVGSYPPRDESHEYRCPVDEAPKGMMARGHYKVKSKFVDDDKNVHLAWEWSMEIKKDWA